MKKNNESLRILLDKAHHYWTCFLCLLILIPLLLLVNKLIIEGFRHISLEALFYSQPTQTEVIFAQLAGERIPGGIANGILGSFYIIIIALAAAIPIGLLSGIFCYAKRHYKFIQLFLYTNNILMGVPAVIIGIVIYLWVVKSLFQFSALAGGIAIAIVIFPYITRSAYQILTRLPSALEESSMALGAGYAQTVFMILVPSIRKELTGYILHAAARGLGVTAPLFFTALGRASINWDMNQPVSALGIQIWSFFSNPYMISLMWLAALVLVLIVIVLHINAKILIGNQKVYNNE